MAERNIVIGHRAESLPPSEYVQRRNAMKDAADAEHRRFVEQNERERLAIAKRNEQIGLNHLTIAQEGLRLRQQAKLIEQEAQMHKLNMELLERAQEEEFLAALQKLDPTKSASLNAARALMAKYPVTHYSESTKEALSVFNRHLNEAVHQDFIKAEADKAKAEAAKEKKAESLRASLDTHKAGLEAAIQAADAYRETKPGEPLTPAIASQIALHSGQIANLGKRLLEADPETAPIVEEANARVKTYQDASKQAGLEKRHSELAKKIDSWNTFTRASEKAKTIAEINPVKKQLGYNLLDEKTGAEIPASASTDSIAPTVELPKTPTPPESVSDMPYRVTGEGAVPGAPGEMTPKVSPIKETSSAGPSASFTTEDGHVKLDLNQAPKLANTTLPKLPVTAPKNAFAPVSQASESTAKQYSDDLLAQSAASREASRLARIKADEQIAAAQEQRMRFAAAAAPSVPSEGVLALRSQEHAAPISETAAEPTLAAEPVVTAAPTVVPVAVPTLSASEPAAPVIATVKRPPLEDIFK